MEFRRNPNEPYAGTDVPPYYYPKISIDNNKFEKRLEKLVDNYIKNSHLVIRILDWINRRIINLIDFIEPKTKAHKKFDKEFERL